MSARKKLLFQSRYFILVTLFVFHSGLSCIGQSGFFSIQANTGIGFYSKFYEPDTTCNMNTSCLAKYFQVKREFINRASFTYNTNFNKLPNTYFHAGVNYHFFRTRKEINPKYEAELHQRYPEVTMDSIIQWTHSAEIIVGVNQNLIEEKLDIFLSFTKSFMLSRVSATSYSDGELLTSSKTKISSSPHILLGLEYSLNDKLKVNFIWDAPVYLSSGYRSYQRIFLFGCRYFF